MKDMKVIQNWLEVNNVPVYRNFENFHVQIFCVQNFGVKIFCGLWQPTKIKHMKCLLYINIHAFNFCGLPASQKYLNNENFPNYST